MSLNKPPANGSNKIRSRIASRDERLQGPKASQQNFNISGNKAVRLAQHNGKAMKEINKSMGYSLNNQK